MTGRSLIASSITCIWQPLASLVNDSFCRPSYIIYPAMHVSLLLASHAALVFFRIPLIYTSNPDLMFMATAVQRRFPWTPESFDHSHLLCPCSMVDLLVCLFLKMPCCASNLILAFIGWRCLTMTTLIEESNSSWLLTIYRLCFNFPGNIYYICLEWHDWHLYLFHSQWLIWDFRRGVLTGTFIYVAIYYKWQLVDITGVQSKLS